MKNTTSYAVSLIIPIYNCEKFLPKTLESLFSQTLENIEFIFIDDNSSDNSIDVLHSIINNYPNLSHRIKFHKQKINTGIAEVRNVGISLAEGIYIGWVDGDDWIDSTMYEELYLKAKKENADIVWCDYFNVYNDTEVYVKQTSNENSLDCIKAMLSGKLLGGMCNKITKRELFSSYNILFPKGLNMCEDLRVNIQLFHYSKKVSYLPKGLYKYVKYNEASISTLATSNSSINYDWVENVKGIVNFIETRKIRVDKLSLDKFKLSSKKNLLIRGRDIEDYRNWKKIFPESNYTVGKSNYPFIYKVLAQAIELNLWFVVRAWVFLKYNLLKK